jgi:hypothetical protein
MSRSAVIPPRGIPRVLSSDDAEDIQEWDAAGVSHIEIARRLNERGVPLPLRYVGDGPYAGDVIDRIELAVPVVAGNPSRWSQESIPAALELAAGRATYDNDLVVAAVSAIIASGRPATDPHNVRLELHPRMSPERVAIVLARLVTAGTLIKTNYGPTYRYTVAGG